MIQVTVENSYSKIVGLTLSQEKKLKERLSFTVGGKSAFFSAYGPRRRSLLSKRGEFPTGLLYRVYAYLDKECDDSAYYVKENRGLRSNNRIDASAVWNGVVPYEDQVKAVAAALSNKRGIIAMPTGTGKSLVIAMIAAELKVRTLVVVPSLEIKKQLLANLATIFGGQSWLVVENIDSKNLNTAIDYDCLIIDEAHHAAARTYQKLNKNAWNNIYYRFFLTATPFRNDPEEELLFESIAGKIIFNLSYKDAVKKGYIVPVEAYYVELSKQETDAYTWSEVYQELVVSNQTRNDTVSQILNTLNKNNVYTLCLVKEVRHGHTLSSMTGLPFAHGEDAASRDYIHLFNRGEMKVLIATEGILGEGVDTKPCEYIIIAGLGKSKSALMQKVGRAVRKYPGKESAKVIIFKDRSHKHTQSHFNTQRKIILAEYGINVVELNL